MFTHLACAVAMSAPLALFTSDLFASEMSSQRQVFKSTSTDKEYRLTLSALKTVNAAIVAEREIVLSGDIERVTYEFLPNIKLNEAWELLRRSEIGSAYRELFSCEGLACGSSNAWANNRFEIKQLYGLDQSQKYRVFAVNDNTYLVLYFVQRGNRRIYAQIDRIVTNQPVGDIYESYTTIVNLLDKQGFYALTANANGFGEEQISQVARALKIKPISKFYLVGHCYSEREEQANVSCAEALAAELETELLSAGIKKRRLSIRSVGELAPRSADSKNRVEIVQK